MAIRLFDAHCHLQDPRVFDKAPQLISEALHLGVVHFAVNGISEKDWHLVKEMGESYPSVIPCFGLHPWFIADRTENWFNNLKKLFEITPSAAVGEIGLDKGPLAKDIDFADQVIVFRKQLELAKELKRPAEVHCVDAFEDLLEIMRPMGHFPDGIILHSYKGSAELVPELNNLGCYFSISGHTMSMNEMDAKKMLNAVPRKRLLLETDAPDALPKPEFGPLFPIDGNPSLNHPANIRSVLNYVSSMLDMDKEEVAELTYNNSVHLFSYKGSKI